MRTPTYYRIRTAVRLTVWAALALLALHTLQAVIWLAWIGLGS